MSAVPLDLGGPGPGCSSHRLRQLAAGELDGQQREAILAHVAHCERCQATQDALRAERATLGRELPFDVFASGVAEKLARGPRARVEPARRWPRSSVVAPLAAAAALAAFSLPFWSHRDHGDSGNRIKGAASVSAYVRDSSGARALRAGESLSDHAQIQLSLQPAGRPYAAAVLWESRAVSPLYGGPARPGPLPSAFEWDGRGRAIVVVRFSDSPLEAQALAEELRGGGPPMGGGDTWTLELQR